MEVSFCNGRAQMEREQKLTSSALESQIKEYDYQALYAKVKQASGSKDNSAEKASLPPINVVFYGRVFLCGKVPSPEQLIKAYYAYYFPGGEREGERICYRGAYMKRADIDARILRTYPSLVRDFHFYLKLVESQLFDEVSYSTKDDINGMDILVCHKKRTVIISLMVDTLRSRAYKERKNATRHVYEYPELQLRLNLNTADRCGDFKLYGERHVEEARQFVYGLTGMS